MGEIESGSDSYEQSQATSGKRREWPKGESGPKREWPRARVAQERCEPDGKTT